MPERVCVLFLQLSTVSSVELCQKNGVTDDDANQLKRNQIDHHQRGVCQFYSTFNYGMIEIKLKK